MLANLEYDSAHMNLKEIRKNYDLMNKDRNTEDLRIEKLKVTNMCDFRKKK